MVESCRSAQIINSLGKLAVAHLKLAAHEMIGIPARSATAQNARIRVFVINVDPWPEGCAPTLRAGSSA